MKYKLYHGNSPYLSLREVHTFIQREREQNKEIVTIQADITEPRTIIDTIHSPNLFFSARTIILKRTYKNKQKDIFLEKLLKSIETNQSEDIIIFWEDQKVKSNTKYYKFFKKDNSVEEKESLNKRTFLTWLKEEIKRNNIEIDTTAQKELAERTNYDPERCANELKKLSLITDQITIKDIQKNITDTLEKDIWRLIDSINNQEKSKSISILEKLQKQRIDPNYTISMLARNLRLITLTKHLLQKNIPYKEISSILKIPPFTLPSLVEASKGYTNEKIKKIYTKLANLDFQIKRGIIDGNLGLTLILPYI